MDDIRSRHFAVAPAPVVGGEPDVCMSCDQWWPCDTRIVLDALENVQAVFMRLQEFCEESEPGLLDAFWFGEHNRMFSPPPSEQLVDG